MTLGNQTAVVKMTLGDGTVVDQFTSLSLRDTYTDPLGSYEFVFEPQRARIVDYAERIRKGSRIDVTVGGRKQGRTSSRRCTLQSDGKARQSR